MKTIIPLFALLLNPAIKAQEGADKRDVELTLMAVGDPSGGKLQSNSSGCAVVHFLNRTKEAIYVPTAPRSLGLGRVKDWSDASYLSPKQGEDYGWGYRAAHDIPKVRIEFLSQDGKVIHTDSSIQLQRIGLIKAEVWGFTPMLFSTPVDPGTYTLRFSFDNTMMAQDSGHSFGDAYSARLVTFTEKIEIPDVLVIPTQAEQAGTGQPATRPESKSKGGDKPQPEAEGRSR
jgi:hypothetical protein